MMIIHFHYGSDSESDVLPVMVIIVESIFSKTSSTMKSISQTVCTFEYGA